MRKTGKILVTLFPLAGLLFSCAQEKNMNIDEGLEFMTICQSKDKALVLTGSKYSLLSQMSYTSPESTSVLTNSLEISYSNDPAYVLSVKVSDSTAQDSYTINKAGNNYTVSKNNGTFAPSDPVNDAYIATFFEFPSYLVLQNQTAVEPALNYLSSVSKKETNPLTSYNLTTTGAGEAKVTLRGKSLAFSSFFSETNGVIQNNVTSISLSFKNYLLVEVDASFTLSNLSTLSARKLNAFPASSGEKNYGGTIKNVFSYQ